MSECVAAIKGGSGKSRYLFVFVCRKGLRGNQMNKYLLFVRTVKARVKTQLPVLLIPICFQLKEEKKNISRKKTALGRVRESVRWRETLLHMHTLLSRL